MANTDTLKAIIANIRTILSNVIGYKVEDLSIDPDVDTTPHASVNISGVSFGDNSGENSLWDEVDIEIKVNANKKTSVLSSDIQSDIIYNIRSNFTVEALNIDDLLISKLVSNVTHNDVNVEYEPPVSTITYSLNIRYRLS